MRKGILLIIAVLVLSVPGLAFAQMEKEEGVMEHKGMEHGMMKGGMLKAVHPMMGPLVVPTADGGVVVVTGNKMTKYDQDLDVIGRAEIAIDMEAMKKGCPMLVDDKEEPKDDVAQKEAPTDAPSVVEPAAETKPADVDEPVAEAKPADVIEPVADAKAVVAEAATEVKAVVNETVPVVEQAVETKPADEVKPADESAAVVINAVVNEESVNAEQK
jgi:hypothetical protein